MRQVQARRRDALQQLVRLHDKLIGHKRLRRHTKKLRHKIHWREKAPHLAAEPQYGPWCRGQLVPAGECFFALAAGKLTGDETLHEMRIAGKRLRYALELAIVALSPHLCQRLYDALSDLQDRLGEVCDHLAGVGRLRKWLAEAEQGNGRQELRAALAREQKQLAAVRRRFLRWWTAARQQRLHKLWDQALRRS